MNPVSKESQPGIPPGTAFIKRMLDVLCATGFLLTVFPVTCLVVMPILVVAGKGVSPFFVQKRTGYRGRTFLCLKFRTMYRNPQADEVQALLDDVRIIPVVGHFLRRTNIDEFPQFINVLLGDMSVVGPRPHMLRQTVIYSGLIPGYMDRHRIRPGITGYAQIQGLIGPTPRVEDMQRRVEADLEYIRDYSLRGDLRIIWYTGRNLVRALGRWFPLSPDQ